MARARRTIRSAFIAPDQEREGRLDLANAGVFPFFDHVFSDADEAEYAPLMGEAYLKDNAGNPRTPKTRTQYCQKWRTCQMSDHNPLWIELKTDFSPESRTPPKPRPHGNLTRFVLADGPLRMYDGVPHTHPSRVKSI